MLKNISIYLIRFYQKNISFYLGNRCVFYPSCSEYTLQSIEKYGFFVGFLKGCNRIRKCHPFSSPQIDHV